MKCFLSSCFINSGRPKRPPKLNPISMPGAGGGGGGVDNISTVVNTPNNLDRKTTISFDDETIEVEPEDLEVVDQLGRGAYGIVERVRHTRSGKEMAVKRITAISQEQKSLLMDMNVLVQGSQCPNIVKFYGALFWDGDLWIFMEIMDTSLDKFYKKFYKSQLVNQLKNRELILTNPGESRNEDDDEVVDGGAVNGKIPEKVLGKIAASVVNALHYLHTIKIIHRDVKPSNILINRRGQVKLCDFGISGYLVNSIAQTYEAGCKPYMAPERINPDRKREGYDIRSDVWSLGITMVELATGEFPYPAAANFFLQLKRVCTDNPPRLPAGIFSSDFEDFIVQCLQKDYQKRPNYSTLMEHSFVKTHRNNDISEFVSLVLDNDASDQCDN